MLHNFRLQKKWNIHENQMGTLKGENDMGMLIEILHHIPDNLIHPPRAKTCPKSHFHMFLFSHISMSFQNLWWGAKLIWMPSD